MKNDGLQKSRTNSLAFSREFVEDSFDRITGSKLIAGCDVRLLCDAAENYPAWLEAIEKARNRIFFESYIIHEDRQGERFADALIKKLGGGKSLQFFNVHLGTSFFERRRQVYKLFAKKVLGGENCRENRIVAGDFNEWMNGLTTRLSKTNFQAVDSKLHLGKRKTYPGILPVLHPDHVYYDDNFKLKKARLHRSRKALIASDHLPIVAEFAF